MLFSFRSLNILRFEEGAEMAKNIFSIIKADYNFMGRVERAIADRIIAEPDAIISGTLAELASALHVSQGSIINFSRKFSGGGFPTLKEHIRQSSSVTL